MHPIALKTLCAAHDLSPGFTNGVVNFLIRQTSTVTTTSADSRTQPVNSFTILEMLLLGVGFLVVADISTAAHKMISSGASRYDYFTLCAGMHKDQQAAQLSNGEYPACAAMTTGYVFRIENQATVHYLQRVGRTGQLTILKVACLHNNASLASIPMVCASLTLLLLARTLYICDWIGSMALMLYIIVRSINTSIMARRSQKGWKGQLEPGVHSDLLVLMSQDKWIRIQGLTDDIKAMTSGAWLQELNAVQSLLLTGTTIVLYLNIGIVAAAVVETKLLLLSLICFTTMASEWSYLSTEQLSMYGLVASVYSREAYGRRLDMAKQLVSEVKRTDWCVKMGIILDTESTSTAPAHM